MTCQEMKQTLLTVFTEMSDFSTRTIDAGGREVLLAYFSNFSSKMLINRFVLEPLVYTAQKSAVFPPAPDETPEPPQAVPPAPSETSASPQTAPPNTPSPAPGETPASPQTAKPNTPTSAPGETPASPQTAPPNTPTSALDETPVSPQTVPPIPFLSRLTGNKIEPLPDLSSAVEAILSGSVLVYADGMAGFGVALPTKNEEGRSPSEPETENVIRGPHEGFTENGENNAMLLRRRLHTTHLKKVSVKVGTLSGTEVAVMYLDHLAPPAAVEELLRRLRALKTDAVPDSGRIELGIQDGKTAMYPTVGNSERPDKVAAKLCEGRIAVLTDGSPVVLTMPYLFCEAFQVTEDYAKSPWYASFIRLLRFAALLISLYLPPLLTALLVRHRSLTPKAVLSLVEEARASLSFSVFWEILIVFLLFEVVREVGLRMPKAVGAAVGLVGSLILGDSAVEAGIVSSPVLIAVAFSAVCNFMVPPYMNANVLYRFLMIVLSGVGGLFGFAVGIILSLSHMVGKRSLGVPYFSPFAPIDPTGLCDFLYVAPASTARRAPVALTGREVPRDGKDGSA